MKYKLSQLLVIFLSLMLIVSFLELVLTPPITIEVQSGLTTSMELVSVPPASIIKIHNVSSVFGTIQYKAEVQGYQLTSEPDKNFDVYAFFVSLKRYKAPDNIRLLEDALSVSVSITPLDTDNNLRSVLFIDKAPKDGTYLSYDVQNISASYGRNSISYNATLYGFTVHSEENENSLIFTQNGIMGHSALGILDSCNWIIILKLPDASHDGNPYVENSSIAAYSNITFKISLYIIQNWSSPSIVHVTTQFSIDYVLYDLYK